MARILADSTGFSEVTARQVLAFRLDEGDKGIVPRQAELNVKRYSRDDRDHGAQAGVIPPPLPTAERFIDLQCLETAGIR